MSEPPPTEYLPVTYLPGAGGHWRTWEPIASVLAYRREALLVDYPALGEAQPDPSIQSLPDLARWISEQLPERCDMVSCSMGSALALRLALDHPDRVRRLVLVVPCGGMNAARFGALNWRASFRKQRPDAPTWFVDDRVDFSDRLAELLAPTLIIVGDDDPIAPVAIGEFLAHRLPHAKLEVIPGATHDLEEEHPSLVASLIEAHLRR